MKFQTMVCRAEKSSLSLALLVALTLPSGATFATLPQNISKQPLAPGPVNQQLEDLPIAQAPTDGFSSPLSGHRQQISQLKQEAYRQSSLDNYAQAIALLENALQLARQHGDREQEANLLNDIGDVYTQQGNYPQAINYKEQGLAIAQTLPPDSYLLPLLQISLGDVYFLQGNNARALQFYEQVVQTAGQDEDKQFSLEMAWLSIGKVYLRQGNYAKAIAYADQILKNNDPINPHRGVGLHLKGEALFRSGQLVAAETALREALKLYEGGRTQASAFVENSGFDTSDLFEMQAAVSRVLQQTLVAQKKFEAALEVAEWGRSRVFAELLATKLTPEEQKSPQQRAQERFKQQLAEIQKFAQQLPIFSSDQPPNPEQLQQLAEKGEQLQKLFEQFPQGTNLSDNETDNPADNEVLKLLQTPALAPPSIEQIRQVARSKKATIVEYSIISDDTFGDFRAGKEQQLLIWVVQPTGEVAARTVEITNLKEPLTKVVDNSRSAIGVRGRGMLLAFRDTPTSTSSSRIKVAELQSLHQLLIQPIANLLPKDPNAHVIFVPQGSLFMVPFAALQDQEGKYLIERHTVLTAPSIGVLLQTAQQRERLKNNRSTNGSDYLIVGNPTMPSIAFAPGAPPQQLASLPGAEQEAKAIASLLNAQALTGSEATKTKVVQQMQTARIVHLATHGLLDDVQGLGTPGAIALAPDDPNLKDSGLLTASEILGMRLNTELVVLSACDTGKGRITGDGVIGLSRSLVIAGAPSVIVSLWQVPDGPTATLMTQFYQNLQKNPDKAQSLRQAMLSTIKQYPDPKAWAAFTLIGEAL